MSEIATYGFTNWSHDNLVRLRPVDVCEGSNTYVLFADHAKRVQELEEALREIEQFAIYGCGTKQKDVRGKQFAAIQDLARAALKK